MKILPTPNINELKSLSFFSVFNEEEIEQIRGFIENRLYKKDEIIISEEELGDLLFILFKGSVNIVKNIDGGEEVLNTIDKPGGFFGEMSIIEDKPRSAGAVATEDCELLTIEKGNFLALVKQFPDLSMHIAVSIANYLRQTDMKLINIFKQKNREIETAYYKLQAAQEELVRRERLSTVGKLASSIVHDIKNPMTAIRGYAELIKGGGYSTEKTAKFAVNIMNEVDRFLAMTQELLTFATGETGLKREKINLRDFIMEMVESIEQQFIDRGHQVKCRIDYDVNVFIDANRFRRALENICYNALDAMQEKGTFTIEAHSTDFGIKMLLADSGCGMIDIVKTHIFDEFFSHGKSHGTGLGLSITKRIIEEHNGSIKVDSEVDEGTKFTIIFPAN